MTTISEAEIQMEWTNLPMIRDEEAKLVRRIFEMYIDRKSMPQMAFELNEEGLRTKREKEWSTWSVKKVLDNELYVRKYSVAGVEEYKIKDELLGKAHEIREGYKHRKKEMPEDRKRKKIDRIFNQCLEFLDEMEAEEALELSEERREMEIDSSAKDESLVGLVLRIPQASLEEENLSMWEPTSVRRRLTAQ